MFTVKSSVAVILAVLGCAGFYNSMVSAQTLPDHVAKIAEDVYSYGPGDHYYSMFIVTGEGVIAIESISTEHSEGLLQAIREVTDQPVKFMLHSHNHWDHASGGQVLRMQEQQHLLISKLIIGWRQIQDETWWYRMNRGEECARTLLWAELRLNYTTSV